MSRLLEDAERQRFDAVFVIDIDRLTRSRKSIDWEIIKDAFRKGRVKLVTPSQEYDFENEDQEFISDLFSRISAYEKKKILRRMMRGKWEKTRQGKFVGGKAASLPPEKRKFHALKHSIATYLLDAPADISFVKDWLGHANIQNTTVYAQMNNPTRDEHARRFFTSLKVV
jgi:DNA invertase Pin-like site-specific DNA recombinase